MLVEKTKKLKKIYHIGFVFIPLFLGTPSNLQAYLYKQQVAAPPYTVLTAPGISIASHFELGQYTLYIPSKSSFPFNLTVKGPLGGQIVYQVQTRAQLQMLKISEGVIPSNDSNPLSIPMLPKLCPRVKISSQFDQTPSFIGTYHASQDALNYVPTVQLTDPDIWEKNQYKSYTEMDGKNVLLLRHVKIFYDYEDNRIVDYKGPHPLTFETQIIHEGDGGFYANIHYAIVPYSQKILELDRQDLLHLAQGKLEEISKNHLMPPLRVHSLIPGPFVSSTEPLYQLCEWGDTAYQAPVQQLNYEQMALWDWDYSIDSADHLLMIVWEGDEEEWLLKKELIHPFTLTDDIIGIFEIKKKGTQSPLKLSNKNGDFEITVETGDLKTIDH